MESVNTNQDATPKSNALLIVIGTLFVIALFVGYMRFTKETTHEAARIPEQKEQVKQEVVQPVVTQTQETKVTVPSTQNTSDDINSIENDLKNTDISF